MLCKNINSCDPSTDRVIVGSRIAFTRRVPDTTCAKGTRPSLITCNSWTRNAGSSSCVHTCSPVLLSDNGFSFVGTVSIGPRTSHNYRLRNPPPSAKSVRFTTCTSRSIRRNGCHDGEERNLTEGNIGTILIEAFKQLSVKLSRQWWNIKKIIRRVTEGYTVYVLACENGKYYVGSTTNKKQRFKQHLGERGGSKWTKQNKPIRILKEYTRVPAAYYLGLESKVTAEYMLKFGINNVRGAMFSKPKEYTLADLNALTEFLGHYNDLSYKKTALQLQSTLPSPNTSTKSQIKRKKKKAKKGKKSFKIEDRCLKCGKVGHWIRDCPKDEVSTLSTLSTSSSRLCYACGQSGHLATECPNVPQFKMVL